MLGSPCYGVATAAALEMNAALAGAESENRFNKRKSANLAA